MNKNEKIKYETIFQCIFLIVIALLASFAAWYWTVGFAVCCSLFLYFWDKRVANKDTFDEDESLGTDVTQK